MLRLLLIVKVNFPFRHELIRSIYEMNMKDMIECEQKTELEHTFCHRRQLQPSDVRDHSPIIANILLTSFQ